MIYPSIGENWRKRCALIISAKNFTVFNHVLKVKLLVFVISNIFTIFFVKTIFYN